METVTSISFFPCPPASTSSKSTSFIFSHGIHPALLGFRPLTASTTAQPTPMRRASGIAMASSAQSHKTLSEQWDLSTSLSGSAWMPRFSDLDTTNMLLRQRIVFLGSQMMPLVKAASNDLEANCEVVKDTKEENPSASNDIEVNCEVVKDTKEENPSAPSAPSIKIKKKKKVPPPQFNNLDQYEIIKHPHMTDYAMKMFERLNTVTLIVDIRADKKMIREIVKKMYGVQPKKVNTLITPSRTKKAYVILKSVNDALDLAKKVGII